MTDKHKHLVNNDSPPPQDETWAIMVALYPDDFSEEERAQAQAILKDSHLKEQSDWSLSRVRSVQSELYVSSNFESILSDQARDLISAEATRVAQMQHRKLEKDQISNFNRVGNWLIGLFTGGPQLAWVALVGLALVGVWNYQQELEREDQVQDPVLPTPAPTSIKSPPTIRPSNDPKAQESLGKSDDSFISQEKTESPNPLDSISQKTSISSHQELDLNTQKNATPSITHSNISGNEQAQKVQTKKPRKRKIAKQKSKGKQATRRKNKALAREELNFNSTTKQVDLADLQKTDLQKPSPAKKDQPSRTQSYTPPPPPPPPSPQRPDSLDKLNEEQLEMQPRGLEIRSRGGDLLDLQDQDQDSTTHIKPQSEPHLSAKAVRSKSPAASDLLSSSTSGTYKSRSSSSTNTLPTRPQRRDIIKLMRSINISSCEHLLPQPREQEMAKVRLHIISSGEVKSAQFLRDPYGNALLGDCLEYEIKQKRLPSFSETEIKLTMPLLIPAHSTKE